ncbi:MAG: phytanoyl-CoA dioxygenase family protein [Alphaproteobacteria bacterium]|nr:phytanoyl-CoA dioxygenase family protein [Alphaproteobacteria bacterium]
MSQLANILSNDKLIPSAALNRLGLQLARICAARTLLHVRRMRDRSTKETPTRQLIEQGYCTIPNFLSERDLALVRREFDAAQQRLREQRILPLLDRVRTVVHSETISGNESIYPETTRSVLRDERFVRIVMAHEGQTEETLYRRGMFKARFERALLHDGGPTAAYTEDTNSDLHSDTFYSITKAYLYLRPTDADSAAFVFVPKSHRLHPRRLLFEYSNSVGIGQRAPRITDVDLEKWGLRKVTLSCDANTLMIANTFGWHARGIFSPGHERHSVFVEYRSNALRL